MSRPDRMVRPQPAVSSRAVFSRAVSVAVAVLGAVFLTTIFGSITGCGRDVPPNIVLVTLDTTRADRFGAYGSTAGLTPRLDELASRSTVFELAIAQSGVTPVSHASIFTGQNPYGHGLRVLHGSRYLLEDEAVTLAELMSDAGYATAAMISAFPAGSRFGLAQGFQVFDEEFLEPPGPDTVHANGSVDTGRAQRRADATTDRAIAWLRQAEGPFFLWVHYFDPHDADVLPPEDFRSPSSLAVAEAENPLEAVSAIYDHEMAFMDAEAGRLIDALDELAPGAAVVLTADHGEALGEHDWWGHGLLYQEQIHVPLIVRVPDAGPAGRRVETMVRSIDLAPTILDLAGFAGERPPMDGRSLVPLLSGEGSPAGDGPPAGGSDPSEWAYADLLNKRVYPGADGKNRGNDDFLLALVAPPWKYIHHLETPRESELFHLRNDPAELDNLLAERPDLVALFGRRLQSLDPLPKGPPPKERLNEEEIERLRALGYVD